MLLIVEEDHCDQKCVKCRPTSDDGRNGQPDYVRCSPVTVDNASQAVLVSLRITEYKNLIFISIYDTHAGVEKKSNEHSNPSDQITRPHHISTPVCSGHGPQFHYPVYNASRTYTSPTSTTDLEPEINSMVTN